ncbi:MAG: type II 3-dehydroquinate dehydratase [Geminicoccaceae bacterium]
MPAVLILNGPNLNLLGRREPGIHGHATPADIAAMDAAEGERPGRAAQPLDEPLIEVHLSNIYQRETFRQHCHVSLLCLAGSHRRDADSG